MKNKPLHRIDVFSDASISDYKKERDVGVASVMIVDDNIIESRCNCYNSSVGSSTEHEYNGILLSMELLKKVSRRKKYKNSLVVIHSDNAQAISHITNSESFTRILSEAKEFGHSISINYCDGSILYHKLCHNLSNIARKKLIAQRDRERSINNNKL